MTEKQLRSLRKIDMLKIMRMQEEEIERLDAENKALAERLGTESKELAERLRAENNELSERLRAENRELSERLRAENNELAERLGAKNRDLSDRLAEAERRAAENEALAKRLGAENRELSERLSERVVLMEKAGSIAEASVLVGGLMQAAQESANIYLESLRVMESEYMSRIDEKENEANRRAEEIIREAEQRAAAREELEKQTVEALWHDFKERVDRFTKAHAELEEMLRANPFFARLRPEGKSGGGEA
jgi:DNA repair exonuclease SbcCD ATPase subunit